MNLQTLVSCRLNPLKFCLPIIVKTFASIMRLVIYKMILARGTSYFVVLTAKRHVLLHGKAFYSYVDMSHSFLFFVLFTYDSYEDGLLYFRQRQLLFCDTIIERNRRHDLSVEGSQANQGVNPLDSFFPFDPYILKRYDNLRYTVAL